MATRNPETRYANYSAKDLIKRGEPLDRLELISVESIIREDDLIDTRRVEVLKKDILRSTRGQVSPVAVRARLEKGKIVYDVIDGFHRAEAIRLINQSSEHPIMVKATVLYGCNDEELYDRRVVAADNVKSIKFARMAKWMTASFKSRKWGHQGITSLVKNGDLNETFIHRGPHDDCIPTRCGKIVTRTGFVFYINGVALLREIPCDECWPHPYGVLIRRGSAFHILVIK